CREIKIMGITTKIIMITAKTTANDEFLGLAVGADDYIKKPFQMNILLLRIKKLCDLEKVLRYKGIVLNVKTHEVTLNGKFLDLTKKEYELLKYFLLNQNVILSREQFLNYIWGKDYLGDVRTVDTHILRLRKKIGSDYIHTKIGTGYIMGAKYE
ncbi:MAG: response regulator transcription factor, partial [Lachnospirales bacterium]